NCLARGNGNLRARTRISTDAGLAGLHGEHSEAAKFDSIAMLKSAFHLLKHRFDGHFSLCLGDARLVDNFIDDVEFDQTTLQCVQTDDRIRVISMSSNGPPRSGETDAGLLAPIDATL